MIKFLPRFDAKQLKEIFTPISVRVGIFKDTAALGRVPGKRSEKGKNNGTKPPLIPLVEKYQGAEGTKVLINEANKTKSGTYFVSSIFDRIISTTPFLSKYLGESFYKSDEGVWRRWLISNKAPSDERKLSNGILAMFKQAYMKMARDEKPNKKTSDAKGHTLHYIQTATTFRAIGAEKVKGT